MSRAGQSAVFSLMRWRNPVWRPLRQRLATYSTSKSHGNAEPQANEEDPEREEASELDTMFAQSIANMRHYDKEGVRRTYQLVDNAMVVGEEAKLKLEESSAPTRHKFKASSSFPPIPQYICTEAITRNSRLKRAVDDMIQHGVYLQQHLKDLEEEPYDTLWRPSHQDKLIEEIKEEAKAFPNKEAYLSDLRLDMETRYKSVARELKEWQDELDVYEKVYPRIGKSQGTLVGDELELASPQTADDFDEPLVDEEVAAADVEDDTGELAAHYKESDPSEGWEDIARQVEEQTEKERMG